MLSLLKRRKAVRESRTKPCVRHSSSLEAHAHTHTRTHTYSIMVFEPIDIMSVGVGNIKEVACPYCRCTKTS